MDRAPPHAQATLKRVMAERAQLYSRVPPPGVTILVTIEPFVVEDGVPTEAEIEWAVKRLRNNRALNFRLRGDAILHHERLYGDRDGVSRGGVSGCTVWPAPPLPA